MAAKGSAPKGSQIAALVKKSWHVQKRATGINICVLLTPILLMIFLLGVQALVDSFLPEGQGPVLSPALEKPIIFLPRGPNDFQPPTFDTNCPYTATAAAQAAFGTLDYTNPSNPVTTGPVASNIDFSKITYKAKRSVTNMTNPLPIRMTQQSSTDALNSYLLDRYATPNHVVFGYQFNTLDTATQSADYTVVYNRTVGYVIRPGGFLDNQNTTNVVGNSLLINDAMFRLSKGSTAASLIFRTKRFPTPDGEEIEFDIVGVVEDFYYLLILHFLFPVFMATLVQEKEHKLRYLMNMMGLDARVYWMVTFVWDYLFYILSMLLFMITGVILQFRFFTINGGANYVLLFFFWGLALVSFSFFVATFFRTQSTALVVGYIILLPLVLISTIVNNTLLGQGDSPNAAAVFFTSLIPTFSLSRGIILLSLATRDEGPGISNSEMASGGMLEIYGYLIGVAILYLLATWWLEQVVPGGLGVAKKPFFCLQKDFMRKNCCCGKSDDESKAKDNQELMAHALEEEHLPHDVQAERDRAVSDDSRDGVSIVSMRKQYPHAKEVALKSVSLRIPQGECFGLLGHNGAGKTTLISILSGLFEPTSGEAIIDGKDVRSQMSDIYGVMGVCPQFDVLWPDMSGREHLQFFGRIKGLKGSALDEEVNRQLDGVRLQDAKNRLSKKYSGGMKRRLSVAISLMGDPKVVFLDEPTTGLDPHSRQEVWKAIKATKKGRAMILTTHSMEEADFLCDRVGIMASGALQCLGVSDELKLRYGAGYKLGTSCPHRFEESVRSFVMHMLPNARLQKHIGHTSYYEVPRSDVELATLFEQFEANKQRLGLDDWGISETTLEEVFLKVGEIAEGEGQHHHSSGRRSEGSPAAVLSAPESDMENGLGKMP